MTGTVRMSEARVTSLELRHSCRTRPGIDDAGQVAEVVRNSRCQRQRGRRRRPAIESGCEDVLLAVELRIDALRKRRRVIVEPEHERAAERSGPHRQPLAVVSGQPVGDTRGDDTCVPGNRFVDAIPGLSENLRRSHRDPAVVPNVSVDVGRNERCDRRVMRSQTQSEGAHERGSLLGRLRRPRRRRAPRAGAQCGSSQSHAAVFRTCSTRTEFSIPCFNA